MQVYLKSFLNFFSSIFCVLYFSLLPFDIEATYIQVYSTTDNGGLSWTGNVLGLNKATNLNQPGTAGSIGAFTTTNTALQVGNFPPGTTLNWTQNSSNAVLDIPTDSTILHAELVWAGSYGYDPVIVGPVLNTPITFIDANSVSHTITPNPLTAQSRVDTGTRGFYVRSADVTTLVTGSGTYTVGGVPATAIATENASNCAGWTLMVAYENPNSLTSNLTLFVACETAGAPPALVSGFHAPDTGAITSRLFVSALEGDPQITGDHLLVGATLPLSYPANRVSGTNNPVSNFFASQINTVLPLTTDLTSGKLIASGSSLLDMRGTFGTMNSFSTGTAVSGARQGYDITSVDLGSQITNGQQQLYIQGTTTGDGYTITSLGIALEVFAPIIKSVKSANTTLPVTLGEIITYTIDLSNVGGNDASTLVFKDLLPPGLTYLVNSFLLNGVPVPGADIVNGTPIGNLAAGASAEVSFEVTVTTINPPTSFENAAMIDYSFVPFNGQTPLSLVSQTNNVMLTAVALPPPVAVNDQYSTRTNTVLDGSTVLANDTGTNLSILTNSQTTVPGGSVMVRPDGSFIYIPPTDFSGDDSFTYEVQDAIGQTASATVFITVLPQAMPDSATVTADSTLTQNSSVLANDLGTLLTVTASDTTSTQGGTVHVNPNGTYTYTPAANFSGIDTFNYTITDSTGNSSSTIVTINVLPAAANNFGITPVNTTLNGTTDFSNNTGTETLISYEPLSSAGGTVTMSAINGSYIYTPPLNFSGIDTYHYTVSDMSGNLTTATVTITVTPLAVNDANTTPVNTLLMGTSVLTNDLGTTLSILTYDPASIRGGQIVMDTITGTYTYNPPLNFTGIDTFTYTIQDSAGSTSTAIVTITITPSTVGDVATTIVNVPLVGPSVLTNDIGTALQVEAFQNPSTQGGLVSMNADGTYAYVPPLNFSGIDTFTYTAIDGAGTLAPPATVTITVLPLAQNDTNTTPENTTLNGASVLTNDEGSNLSIVNYQRTSTQGGVVIINPNGTYTYTPPLNFVGIDSFTYTLQDTIGSQSTGTVTIIVTPAPPLPITFVGKIKKCQTLDKRIYRIQASFSSDPNAVLYRIYLNNSLFLVIPANAPHKFTKKIPSKDSAYTLQISSVNSSNIESPRTLIRIVK